MGMNSSKVTSKRMLVAFDPARPEEASSDFLVPVIDEGGIFTLFGTRSRRSVPLGMVVLVGKEVTANDVFARLVDAGRKILSVAEALNSIGDYLAQINNFKIGQVVEIVNDTEKKSFRLEPSKIKRVAHRKPLP
jgi:hypothetical protein